MIINPGCAYDCCRECPSPPCGRDQSGPYGHSLQQSYAHPSISTKTRLWRSSKQPHSIKIANYLFPKKRHRQLVKRIYALDVWAVSTCLKHLYSAPWCMACLLRMGDRYHTISISPHQERFVG